MCSQFIAKNSSADCSLETQNILVPLVLKYHARMHKMWDPRRDTRRTNAKL